MSSLQDVLNMSTLDQFLFNSRSPILLTEFILSDPYADPLATIELITILIQKVSNLVLRSLFFGEATFDVVLLT